MKSARTAGTHQGPATPQSAQGTVLGVTTLPNSGFPLTQAGIPEAMLTLGGLRNDWSVVTGT